MGSDGVRVRVHCTSEELACAGLLTRITALRSSTCKSPHHSVPECPPMTKRRLPTRPTACVLRALRGSPTCGHACQFHPRAQSRIKTSLLRPVAWRPATMMRSEPTASPPCPERASGQSTAGSSEDTAPPDPPTGVPKAPVRGRPVEGTASHVYVGTAYASSALSTCRTHKSFKKMAPSYPPKSKTRSPSMTVNVPDARGPGAGVFTGRTAGSHACVTRLSTAISARQPTPS